MINRRTFLTLASAIACMRGMNAEAAAPLRLVFIHGRSQQGLDPVVLKKTWSDALISALAIQNLKLPASIDIEFPYYGDALDKFVNQSKIQVASQVRARGSVQQDDFLAFQAQVANELVVNAGVSDAQIDAEYGNNPKTRGPLNWEWVQAILQALDKHGGGLSADAIEAFTRDVYLYLTSDLVRDQIDKIVLKTMNREPTIVVGHSLGSVVAYNVLKTNPDFKVPMLVTIGSPLGIRAIRTPLSPIGFPRSVTSWFNAYDTRDVVALNALDSANFAIRPPIENYSGVRNGTSNRHGITGYLGDPTVARKIHESFV
ncbi:alpha/beta hydrolase [Rhizobium leguminosarum]|uniref:alpha/beta hydrolase n=1 Tax=Rhizobium leguminosarum TaxID=384 RepID=UPI000FEC5416|nr:alpha/beta hydrolase [Rhizobium leguminosarum]MBY5666202.1 lipase family protein [Rhizobium leguminosarum]MBY5679500.1 lipase family protein [Rhizobium leguminosarum]RWX33226.1 alpha/beta hydrolase [Rhizobium leguminosarum]